MPSVEKVPHAYDYFMYVFYLFLTHYEFMLQLDYAIWGWFARLPVLKHYRNYELPANLPRYAFILMQLILSRLCYHRLIVAYLNRLEKWLAAMHSDSAVKETVPDIDMLFRAYESYAHPHKKWSLNVQTEKKIDTLC